LNPTGGRFGLKKWSSQRQFEADETKKVAIGWLSDRMEWGWTGAARR
jgi:hypothetical protein